MKHDQQPWSAGLPHTSYLRFAKRISIAIIGGTITLIGVALIVLPGPALIVIPVGLSILATEFLWAKRWLRKARELVIPIKAKSPPHVL